MNQMTDSPRRRLDTAIPCPHCGEGLSGRNSCKLCGGAGVVSREMYTQYHRDREQKITAKIQVWEEVIRGYVTILSAAKGKTERRMALADWGNRLLREFELASSLPSGDPRRLKVCNDMFLYQKQVLNFLGGGR